MAGTIRPFSLDLGFPRVAIPDERAVLAAAEHRRDMGAELSASPAGAAACSIEEPRA